MDAKFFSKDASTLAQRIYVTVSYYVASGLLIDDELMLQVNRVDHTVDMVMGVGNLPNCDYYAMRDFVVADDRGAVTPDEDAVARVVADYAVA